MQAESKQKDLLLSWLSDAHAMELALIPILENHARDVKDHPEMRARIERHVEETRRHADIVKQCAQRLGKDVSSAKNLMGKVFGAVQGPATGAFSDEVVKNCIMDFATENFEIGCYRALITASEDTGNQDIASACRSILLEEEEMARWLAQQLPVAVRTILLQEAAAR